MYLCCVESVNQNWIFYEFLKLLKNRLKDPVPIVQGHQPNFIKNDYERIQHFYNFFLYIYMCLCCMESLN